ncbi:hypothetical protein C6P45_001151 [Maudiozyma exigua]|uniref:Temperature shock-inducible protein 1 n=1 Tax=Maudiozyma exigua TaxID=34358 RepID=A0A9P7BD17_MAUEX|nr:hypothetical protein C6P45_001151 [Kazachstania exigua]
MYSKFVFAVAATAVLVNAQTASQLAELNTIVDDVKSHLSDYLGLISSGAISLSDLPAGVMPVVLAVQTATDESYTSLYKDVDVAALGPFLSRLPWYSSRLQPELDAANVGENVAATSSAAAPVSSSTAAAPASSSTAAAPASSSSVIEASSSESSITSVATSAAPSSSATVSQQSENKAGKLSNVMGLAAVGAVAMLL